MVKAPAESPDFEASGSEFGDSDSGDAAVFSGSGSSVFSASDGEEQDLPKRRYARRRASFQQFLGRPVCKGFSQTFGHRAEDFTTPPEWPAGLQAEICNHCAEAP